MVYSDGQEQFPSCARRASPRCTTLLPAHRPPALLLGCRHACTVHHLDAHSLHAYSVPGVEHAHHACRTWIGYQAWCGLPPDTLHQRDLGTTPLVVDLVLHACTAVSRVHSPGDTQAAKTERQKVAVLLHREFDRRFAAVKKFTPLLSKVFKRGILLDATWSGKERIAMMHVLSFLAHNLLPSDVGDDNFSRKLQEKLDGAVGAYTCWFVLSRSLVHSKTDLQEMHYHYTNFINRRQAVLSLMQEALGDDKFGCQNSIKLHTGLHYYELAAQAGGMQLLTTNIPEHLMVGLKSEALRRTKATADKAREISRNVDRNEVVTMLHDRTFGVCSLGLRTAAGRRRAATIDTAKGHGTGDSGDDYSDSDSGECCRCANCCELPNLFKW